MVLMLMYRRLFDLFIIYSSIPDECGSVFTSLKNEVADPENSAMEFEFLIEGKEFSFDNTEMARASDEGCSGITFGLNLTIIILVVVIIIVIVLLVIFCKKSGKELPVEDKAAAEEKAAAEAATETTTEAAPETKVDEVAVSTEPTSAPAPEPAPAPAPEAPAPEAPKDTPSL